MITNKPFGWATPWGTLILQSQRGLHDSRRVYYPVWHSNAGSAPKLPDIDGIDWRRVHTKIEKWLTEQGASFTRIE